MQPKRQLLPALSAERLPRQVVCSCAPKISAYIAQTDNRPMPAAPARRKTHSKSRKGCLQCKKRHTKASAGPHAFSVRLRSPANKVPSYRCHNLLATATRRPRFTLDTKLTFEFSAMRSTQHAQTVFGWRSSVSGRLCEQGYNLLHHIQPAWDKVPCLEKTPTSVAPFRHL